jgi:hypothetical protein
MMNKALTIVTLNLCSLGKGCGVRKRKEVKAWIQYLELPLEILLLQKHHSNETQCDKYEKGVELKNIIVFWNLGLQLGHFQHW